MSWGYGRRKYVSVDKRLAQARQYVAKVAKAAGREPQPVNLSGTKIASTFWGKAWCSHLESYSDYSNRLPRGRTYVRNGSVVDLEITAGRVEAIVAGSDVYEVEIVIDGLADSDWRRIRDDCASSIDSLLDLLGGRFSKGVMTRLTDRNDGLFPSPREIHLSCSCPDYAGLCKHLAAVLYGVGARLDERPVLLFLLRDVDHTELVNEAVSDGNLTAALSGAEDELAGEDLGAMFGIDLDVSATAPAAVEPKANAKKRSTAKKSAVKKKAVAKKAAPKKATTKKAVKKSAVKKDATGKKAAKKSATKKKAASPKAVAKKAVSPKPATKKKAAAKKKATVKKAATSKAAVKKSARKA
jgi:uncharacterized Zn finger protein